MKKALILCGILMNTAATALAQTVPPDIDTTQYKLVAPEDVDWAPLINRDYVFFDGPVLWTWVI